MPQKIDNTLLLLRYALGFRDWQRAVKSDVLDPARGGFQQVFYDTAVQFWRRTDPLDEDFTAQDVRKMPAEATMRRWFLGTKPSAKYIPGIIFILNKILEQREKEGSQYIFAGAERVPHIPLEFRIDRFHLSMETRNLAREINVDIEDFDVWRTKGESHVSRNNANEELNEARALSGLYFVYRLSTFHPDHLQRTMMILREEADRDNLAIYMIGGSARPWRGDLVVGRSTLSSLIERSSPSHGRQINTLAVTYDIEELNYKSDVFAGFRTRVISQSETHMQSYRIIVAKQSEEAGLIDVDIDDPADVARISDLCRSEAPQTAEDRRWHEALQVKTTLMKQGRKFQPNRAFNLFALPDLRRLPKKSSS